MNWKELEGSGRSLAYHNIKYIYERTKDSSDTLYHITLYTTS